MTHTLTNNYEFRKRPIVRKELSTLILMSSKSMTVQTENIVLECVDQLNSHLNFIRAILLNCNKRDLIHIFFKAPAHLLLEALYVIMGCLNFYRENKQASVGACPYFLLKTAEKCVHMLKITLVSFEGEQNEFLFQHNDQYKTIFKILTYFSSVDIITKFSCNCMGLSYTGRHITSDIEIGNIILDSGSCIVSMCRLLIINKSGSYFVTSNQLNPLLEVLFETLVNATMSIIKSALKLVASILSSIHEILLFILSFHQIVELEPSLVSIPSDFFVFICKSCTFQLSEPYQQSEVGSNKYDISLKDRQACYADISKKSFLILCLLSPLLKFDPSLVIKMIGTQLPSRIANLIKQLADCILLNIVFEAILKLCAFGMASIFIKNNIIDHLNELELRLNLNEYSIIEKNLINIKGIILLNHILDILRSDNNCDENLWLLNSSHKINQIESESNDKISIRHNEEDDKIIPWLQSINNEQPIFLMPYVKFKGVPTKENIDPVEHAMNPLSTTFCVKQNPDRSILKSTTFLGDLTSDNNVSDETYDGLFLNKSISDKTNQHKTDISLNIVKDKSMLLSTYRKEQSMFEKMKKNTSLFGDITENHNPRKLWKYMSNMFRSKPKFPRS
ncbi:hypothetical protein MXB_3963 [Myxobolus squamalis]|nr:hypothetical protein MXB_3963 [Myxobolus squamalis]